jgi:hypothetical protein
MTNAEKELIAALEADIQKWEFVAGYFEHSVRDMELFDGKKITGIEYARGLRQRIAEHRALIERVKNG